MKSNSFKEIQEILQRRKREAERAQSEEEQSQVWRSAANELRFKTFETQWRKEKGVNAK